jgi:hypothetical protein
VLGTWAEAGGGGGGGWWGVGGADWYLPLLLLPRSSRAYGAPAVSQPALPAVCTVCPALPCPALQTNFDARDYTGETIPPLTGKTREEVKTTLKSERIKQVRWVVGVLGGCSGWSVLEVAGPVRCTLLSPSLLVGMALPPVWQGCLPAWVSCGS